MVGNSFQLIVLIVLFVVFSNGLRIGVLLPLSGPLSQAGLQRQNAIAIAVNDEYINNGTSINVTYYDTYSGPTGAQLIQQAWNEGNQIIVGPCTSAVALSAENGTIPFLSISSTLTGLTETRLSLTTRMVPNDVQQADAIAAIITKYKWNAEQQVGIIATDQIYSQDLQMQIQSHFIPKIIQQFHSGETNLFWMTENIKNAKVHVIVALMYANDFHNVLKQAKAAQLVGGAYVWICSDGCAQNTVFTIENGGPQEQDVVSAAAGLIGVGPCFEQSSSVYTTFLDSWNALYPYLPNQYAAHSYDAIGVVVRGWKEYTAGGNLTVEGWNNAIRSVQFAGASGLVRFDNTGDRDGCTYTITNVVSATSGVFQAVGTYHPSNSSLDIWQPIVFSNGDTTAPLFPSDAKTYFNCASGQIEDYALNITLYDPDGHNPTNIPAEYMCDQFIDCDNKSDEPFSCRHFSLKAAWVLMGIFNGLVLLFAITFIILIIIINIKYWESRDQQPVPSQLILGFVCLLCGVTTIFLSYQKPTQDSCVARHWLLILSFNMLFAIFITELLLLHRIVRNARDLQLLQDGVLIATSERFRCISILLLLVPSVCILVIWNFFSHPGAKLTTIDGRDHYLCYYGENGFWLMFTESVYIGMLMIVGFVFSFKLHISVQYSAWFGPIQTRAASLGLSNLLFVVIAEAFFWVIGGTSSRVWIVENVVILYAYLTSFVMLLWPQVAVVKNFKTNAATLKFERYTAGDDHEERGLLSEDFSESDAESLRSRLGSVEIK